MAIQQSPEKMLPLSDIYKVMKSTPTIRKIIFIYASFQFSLSLIDFHTIGLIRKNGKIH